MTAPARPRPPRGPFVLLGLMTCATVGGPFLIGLVLQGGARASWPPDLPIEWATVLGVSGAVAGLMGACLALARTNRPTPGATRPGDPGEVKP